MPSQRKHIVLNRPPKRVNSWNSTISLLFSSIRSMTLLSWSDSKWIFPLYWLYPYLDLGNVLMVSRNLSSI